MARIRTVKPEFFTSPTVARLSHRARLTFVGLWTYVDDCGRGVDEARLVKAAVWPLDDDVTHQDVDDDLGELADEHLVERWEHVGRRYLRVRSFLEHQRINRPSASRLPPSPEETAAGAHEHSPTAHGAVTEHSPPEVEAEAEVEVEQGGGGGGGGGGGTRGEPDDALDPVEAETRRRIAKRRAKGEDIGPKLEQLIRQDVVRDFATKDPDPPPGPATPPPFEPDTTPADFDRGLEHLRRMKANVA